jgi:hypothetical protein
MSPRRPTPAAATHTGFSLNDRLALLPQVSRRLQRVSQWARLGSNQRPPACEAGALPLSYAPRLV